MSNQQERSKETKRNWHGEGELHDHNQARASSILERFRKQYRPLAERAKKSTTSAMGKVKAEIISNPPPVPSFIVDRVGKNRNLSVSKYYFITDGYISNFFDDQAPLPENEDLILLTRPTTVITSKGIDYCVETWVLKVSTGREEDA